MQRKGTGLLILLTIFLVAGAIYLVITGDSGTIKQELINFAVEDTASVHKIFIADKGNKEVLITRSGKKWFVNNKYPAREEAVNLLLYTLKKMKVKSPVAKAAFENVVKQIASSALKVEVYDKDDHKIKTIFVGGETPDYLGTFMMVENSSAPFVMHIPGFNGFLSSRFIVNEEDWRDKKVFSYQYNEINEVRFEDMNKPEKSFTINANQGVVLSVLDKQENPIDFDSSKVVMYLARYGKISFEGFENKMNKVKKDSILHTIPIYTLSVKDVWGEEIKVAAFRKKAKEGMEDLKGNPLKYDPDRLYAVLEKGGNSDFVLIQYFIFSPLFRSLDSFIKD